MVALKVWRVNNLRDTVFIETILFLMCLVLISLPFFPAWSLVMSELWIHSKLVPGKETTNKCILIGS